MCVLSVPENTIHNRVIRMGEVLGELNHAYAALQTMIVYQATVDHWGGHKVSDMFETVYCFFVMFTNVPQRARERAWASPCLSGTADCGALTSVGLEMMLAIHL